MIRLSEPMRFYFSDDTIRAKMHKQFRHIVIDEFQDCNGLQYELFRTIIENNPTKANDPAVPVDWDNRSFVVVGDGDQAIYGWRGGEVEYIINFDKVYGDQGKKIILAENYRSQAMIVHAAAKVIELNVNRTPKVPVPTSSPKRKINIYRATDEIDERDFMIKWGEDALKRYGQASILCRARTKTLNVIYDELNKARIKVTASGKQSAMHLDEAQAIANALKFIKKTKR